MRVRRSKFVIIFCLISSFICIKKVHATALCNVLLSSPHEINAYEESGLDETDYFIAYLNDLLDGKIITEDQLSHFVLGLRGGEILNPLEGEGGSASEIQGEGIQDFLKHPRLDRRRLLEWANKKLEERVRTQVRREETKGDTLRPFQKMVFYPVRGGRFQMGHRKNKVNVNLTHSIEVMSTQVTQKHWVELMGINPSGFKDGEDSIVVFVDGKWIQMQPDHPVEYVNWWSTLVFANRLSEKHGFTPAYDLSEVKWAPNKSVENGTLQAEGGEIKINSNGGVHDPYDGEVYYQAEGYRLPTEAEQEYMLRAAGRANGRYPFGSNQANLKDYAWYSDNSDGKTHPVAHLKPLVVDGKNFYDLHGNVWEWSWDYHADDLEGGDNPLGPKDGTERVYRGNGWNDYESELGSGFREGVSPDIAYPEVGFRLVRTIGSPKR